MKSYVTPTFVMPSIDSLAKSRETATGIAYLEWFDALTSTHALAEPARIDPDAYLSLVKNSKTPEQLLLVTEALAEFSKENPYGVNCYNYLMQFVENSNYDLAQWLGAIEIFYKWLNKNSRQAGITEILSYINSATKNGAVNNNLELKDIVADTLARFGYQS